MYHKINCSKIAHSAFYSYQVPFNGLLRSGTYTGAVCWGVVLRFVVESSSLRTTRRSSFLKVEPDKQYKRQLMAELRTTPSFANANVSWTIFHFFESESTMINNTWSQQNSNHPYCNKGRHLMLS